jgi:hypothetical protein
MLMTPTVRKLALIAHVTSSVGWFGAVAAFLSLAIAGVTSHNAQTVRAAYLSTELITWAVVVPASVAALLTGIVQSLGTTWGLFRYRWVVSKLALTVVATAILLAHTQPIGRVAAIAAQGALSSGELHRLRIQLVADAGAALVALLVATILSVYKPWGLTSYGRRVDVVAVKATREWTTSTQWKALWIAGLIVAIALFVIAHLVSGGIRHH